MGLASKKANVAFDSIHSSTDKQLEKKVVYDTKDLNLWYGKDHALKNINLSIYEKEVTAIIGPSGCGKSTYIKTLNRMVQLVPIVKISGDISYRGKSILDKSYKVEDLRTRVGMVFQKPNPFPKSIYDNVAYGPRIHGIRNKKILDEIVERSYVVQLFGMKLKNVCMKMHMDYQEDNNNVYVLLVV